ncbi:MAG: hypothetical protein U0556_16575 [Dehalococcoidia bacterium]
MLNDRYRGALLGLSLADADAARLLLDRAALVLEREMIEPGGGPETAGLLALWLADDPARAARQAGELAEDAPVYRAVALVMLAALGGTPPDELQIEPAAIPTEAGAALDLALLTIAATPSFEAGLTRLQAEPAVTLYGLLAGAVWGESGLPTNALARLPVRAEAVAIAGELFERAWAHRPEDSPDVVCEHCQAANGS